MAITDISEETDKLRRYEFLWTVATFPRPLGSPTRKATLKLFTKDEKVF